MSDDYRFTRCRYQVIERDSNSRAGRRWIQPGSQLEGLAVLPTQFSGTRQGWIVSKLFEIGANDVCGEVGDAESIDQKERL